MLNGVSTDDDDDDDDGQLLILMLAHNVVACLEWRSFCLGNDPTMACPQGLLPYSEGCSPQKLGQPYRSNFPQHKVPPENRQMEIYM